MGWDGMGWDGMGWDGMGWDGMEWDGMETFVACFVGSALGVYARWSKMGAGDLSLLI